MHTYEYVIIINQNSLNIISYVYRQIHIILLKY